MSVLSKDPGAPSRPWKSFGAVLLGFVVVFVLSLGTDQILHVMKVYPPWGQPMYDPGLNALALAYRCVFGVVGGYATARAAPHSPMRHAMILGILGFFLTLLGAFAAMGKNLGPMWYPVALGISSIPTAWLGGRLYERGRSSRA